MATVIDELVLELGFDTKKLQTDRADAKAQTDGLKNDLSKIDDEIVAIRKRSVDKTSAEDQKRLRGLQVLRQERKKSLDEALSEGKKEDELRKKQADGFRTVSREAAGFVATLAGFDAIKTLFTNTVQADRALGNLSKNLGVSVQALSAWRTVSKEINGPSGAGDVDSAMQMLVKTGQDFKNGILDPNVKWLQRLGITSTDQMLDPLAGLAAITKHMQGMSQKDRQFFGQNAGLTEGMVNVLGLNDLTAKLTEAKKLAPTAADIKRGQDYAATLSLMGDAWGKLGQTVVLDVGPPLTALAGNMTSLIEKHPKLTARVIELTTALLGLATAAKVLALFGIALPAGTGAAVGGAVGGAVSGAGLAVGDALGAGVAAAGGAAVLGPAAGVAASLIPTAANKGEDAAIAKQRAAALYAKLIAAGIPSQVALGVVAGGIAENGRLDAGATNSKSGAYGIGQWLGPRLKALKAKYGANPTNDQQVEFLISELKGGDAGGASVLGSGSAQEAASNYITKFMRPAKGKETIGDIKRANDALSSMGQSVINHVQSTVTVQQININTKATDAKGIASGINDALASFSYTGQANTGQQ